MSEGGIPDWLAAILALLTVVGGGGGLITWWLGRHKPQIERSAAYRAEWKELLEQQGAYTDRLDARVPELEKRVAELEQGRINDHRQISMLVSFVGIQDRHIGDLERDIVEGRPPPPRDRPEMPSA